MRINTLISFYDNEKTLPTPALPELGRVNIANSLSRGERVPVGRVRGD